MFDLQETASPYKDVNKGSQLKNQLPTPNLGCKFAAKATLKVAPIVKVFTRRCFKPHGQHVSYIIHTHPKCHSVPQCDGSGYYQSLTTPHNS